MPSIEIKAILEAIERYWASGDYEVTMYEKIDKENYSNGFKDAVKWMLCLIKDPWIKVEDKLPDFNIGVIVHYVSSGLDYYDVRWRIKEDKKDVNDFFIYEDEQIDKWMPILESQKE